MSTFLAVRQFASKRGFASTFPRSGKFASCFIDVPLADTSTLLETHGPAEEAGKAMKARLMEMGLAQKGPGAPKGNHNATGGAPPKTQFQKDIAAAVVEANDVPKKPKKTTKEIKAGAVALAKSLKKTLKANPNIFPAGEEVHRQADAEYDAEEKRKREAKRAAKKTAKKKFTTRPAKKLIGAMKRHNANVKAAAKLKKNTTKKNAKGGKK